MFRNKRIIFIHFCLTLFLLSLNWGCSPHVTCDFDVPEGPAQISIKIFAEQAGMDLIFQNEAAIAVRTNRVKGQMTSDRAIKLMLKNTGLSYYCDESLNAIAVEFPTDPSPGSIKISIANFLFHSRVLPRFPRHLILYDFP